MNALAKFLDKAIRQRDVLLRNAGGGNIPWLVDAILQSQNGLALIDRYHQAAAAEAKAEGTFSVVGPMLAQAATLHHKFVNGFSNGKGFAKVIVPYSNTLSGLMKS